MRAEYVAVGIAAVGIVAGLSISRGTPKQQPKGLSPLRTKAIALLDEVLPSAFPSEKFARIAPSYSPEILKKYPTYTTCGELPAFIARSLGFKGKIASAGLELLRTEASARGCWRTLKDGGRPKPGDFYALSSAPDGIIVHVGIIKSAEGDAWKTADAGQGTKAEQRADFVPRVFDKSTGTLSTGSSTKFFAGWVDIDCIDADNKAVS